MWTVYKNNIIRLFLISSLSFKIFKHEIQQIILKVQFLSYKKHADSPSQDRAVKVRSGKMGGTSSVFVGNEKCTRNSVK
jgi:hypothetical protein